MGRWITVARSDEIPEGFRHCVELEGISILLFHLEDGYYAVENKCTHLNLQMTDADLVGNELICPWHGAAFDVRTGDCLGPPGRSDLRTYNVRIHEKFVQIEWESQPVRCDPSRDA